MDNLLLYLKRPLVAHLTIALVALVFYFNTFQNKFALDDGLVYTDNKFVTAGTSGIEDIFSYDSFYGTLGSASELNGGRYRPLSQAMLAVEFEFTGITNDKGVKKPDPYIHHVINVICYVLLCMLIYFFLSTWVFKDNKIAAWVATLMFAIHPIHTEVVANIKSRDELLSLLLLISTLHLTLRFAISKKTIALLGAVLCYALALLAKENGLTFIFIIPLTLYFLSNRSWRFILRTTLPFIALVLAYMALRYSLLGFKSGTVKEIMDNPYVRATFSQKYGTIMYVLLYYLRLLVYPYPLTYDYSFNQIPYRTLFDPPVILSLIIHAGMLAYVAVTWKKRDLLAYCILFYLLSMFIVSNIAINIGAPMGERFLFQSSLAFVIAVVYLYNKLTARVTAKTAPAITVLLLVITVAAFAETYNRNKVWYDGNRLGITDVKVSPNSARANTYAGTDLINISDTIKDTALKYKTLHLALDYFRKSLRIQPHYITTFQNMGVAYHRLKIYDSAEIAWNEVRRIDPKNNNLPMYDAALATFRHSKVINYYDPIFKRGVACGLQKRFDSAIIYFRKALVYDPVEPEGWYNLGGAYFSKGRYDSARVCWNRCLKINPKNTEARKGLDYLNATHK